MTARPCAAAPDAAGFYWRTGALLALVHALRGTDFHHENIIAAGEHPVLVDLEALLHPTAPGKAQPGAQPGAGRAGDEEPARAALREVGARHRPAARQGGPRRGRGGRGRRGLQRAERSCGPALRRPGARREEHRDRRGAHRVGTRAHARRAWWRASPAPRCASCPGRASSTPRCSPRACTRTSYGTRWNGSAARPGCAPDATRERLAKPSYAPRWTRCSAATSRCSRPCPGRGSCCSTRAVGARVLRAAPHAVRRRIGAMSPEDGAFQERVIAGSFADGREPGTGRRGQAGRRTPRPHRPGPPPPRWSW
ncbi:hypothetical protein SANTM175S_04328 [Streptomyces antimycoticus]